MIKSPNDEYLKEVGIKTLVRRQWHSMSAEHSMTFRLTGRVRCMLVLPVSAVPPEGPIDDPQFNVIEYVETGGKVYAHCLGVGFYL